MIIRRATGGAESGAPARGAGRVAGGAPARAGRGPGPPPRATRPPRLSACARSAPTLLAAVPRGDFTFHKRLAHRH